jgi:hypothetical protein
METQMMKVFHFHGVFDYRFAQAGRRGTWHPPNTEVCPECGSSPQQRVPPLILEWEPGSEVVGDFAWLGADDEVVVSQRVGEALSERFRGFELKAIEFWQDPKLRRPQRNTKRTKPRIWLPYEGPPLWDLWVTAWCHLDIQRSGMSLEKVCSTCGEHIYKAPTFERRHLIVDPTSWDGSDIFHIYEYPRWIFCVERVKEFVEQAGFTNVGFLEDGEIPDS